ncbi:hypothetical protein E3Q22_01989 [Wallemia mellicola]|uniref:Uncharacterized protein n=2 Tax=Wallemia mellicola TaxID=1708541 RepID=A0A4T0T319_9BASI|nr:hypothetical protein WALSEDRAFT_66290 [Wallemia mellicola CBS 633.66]TIB68037.1 hypothetical protein E3Q24_03815 [Wallemia mellicola]EIM19535.1 hypothetical protein WALSEDRAFT_66290 [Wallemia mellicola CBS 633.66]TIB80113.1 hypothetical protein E3Q21_03895 [Wallemia mellicola]TIB80269.1 hypothetical protein E3Q22_01989 [Wallemia mellicola]TIB84096.1 hypothetical protein E3Q20_03848 [Wallemia mellicola]|eukprot:XP_006960458.1 hypothetical protein WALSEDRAFT_66290 [Wallemia mellicola CBS 633.66]
MQFLTILSLATAAFAASVKRDVFTDSSKFNQLISSPELEQCYQNQCLPIREKLRSDCLPIIQNTDINSIDTELGFEFGNCVCEGFDFAQQNPECGDCMNDAIDNLTSELDQTCTAIRSDPSNPENDDSSSITNIPPASLLASSLLVVGISFI